MINWHAILSEHGPAVWRTTYRLLNDHTDATDCYQEVFIAAWEYADHESIRCWASFLVSLATRRAIDRLRQRYRSRARFTAMEQVPEPLDHGISPLRKMLSAEIFDDVRREMSNLPNKQAEVFWLSCVEQISLQEISDTMQISGGEVRVLLHRARSRLQKALQPHHMDVKELE